MHATRSAAALVMVGVGLLVGATGSADAQIIPVGPFPGLFHDGFESYGPLVLVSTLDVLSNQAQVSCQQGGSSIQVTAAWSFISAATPHSGQLLIGTAGEDMRVKFAWPARRFGAYFSNISDALGATVDIYDEFGVFITTLPLDVPPAAPVSPSIWRWNGWESQGVGIGRIDINGAFVVPGFIMMDDAEYTPVPDACYADCTSEGILSVADFGCFQGKYVLGDLYADCNASGNLTVADFGCFQGLYVLGCP